MHHAHAGLPGGWLLASAGRVARLCPPHWSLIARGLGGLLGQSLWLFDTAARSRSLERLARCFPQQSDTARRAIARRSFTHLGAAALDGALAQRLDPRRLCQRFTIEGWGAMHAEASAGRLLLVSRLGSPLAWRIPELFGERALLLQDARLEPAPPGACGAEEPAALSRCQQRLAAGGSVLCALPAPAPFAAAPADDLLAELAAAGQGAAVLLTVRLRPAGGYLVRAAGPLPLEAARGAGQLNRACGALLEGEIRAQPEAWPWMC